MSAVASGMKVARHPAALLPAMGWVLFAATLLWWPLLAMAHGVSGTDQDFLRGIAGPQPLAFLYLGAKHMVTGYDHLLFLFGVVFFLYRMREVALYVTLFAVGHSATLLAGVLFGTHANPYLIDAIIALSVVYKALENLDAFQHWFGVRPNMKAAVFIFGLFHGLGLATKVQDLGLSQDGLVVNLIAFNVGVEIGQLLALGAILIAMGYWRRSASFARYAFAANIVLMIAGFVLFGLQMAGYFIEGTAS